MSMFDLGCYTYSSIGHNSIYEILNHIKTRGDFGAFITDRYCVRELPGIGKLQANEVHPYPSLHYGLEIDVIDGSETYRLKCLARTRMGVNNLYSLVGVCGGLPAHMDVLFTYKEGLLMGASGGWNSAAMQDFVDFWFVSPDMDQSYIKQFYEAVKDTDTPLCAVSDGRYIDPALDAEHSNENRMYTESEMIELFSFMGNDAAREIVVHNPFKIGWSCESESGSIDGFPHLPGGLWVPIDNAGMTVSNMLKAALCQKYSTCEFASHGSADPLKTSLLGETAGSADNILVDRLYQEINLICHNGNDTRFLASMRIAEYLRQRGYRPDFCGDINNSLAAHLAGITEVNPMPAHYLCPKCKTLIWIQECADGYDLPDRECSTCGMIMDCDGHDIPYETALRFNKQLHVECNLPYELADERNAIIEYAYPGCITLPCGDAASPLYCVLPNACPMDLAKGISSLYSLDICEICNLVALPTSNTMSCIAKLEAITGIRSDSIRKNDRMLIRYIADPNCMFECGLSGVPEYSNAQAKFIAELLKPTRFSELLKIYGVQHGRWKDNGFLDAVFRLESLSRPDTILFQEDVFRTLKDGGLVNETAILYAYKVSKGSCVERVYESLASLQVPDIAIQEIRKIESLCQKGNAIRRLQTALLLVWYRQHYAAHFFAVLLNHTPYAVDFLAKQPSVFLSAEDDDSMAYFLSKVLAVILDANDNGLSLEKTNGSHKECFSAIDEHRIAYCMEIDCVCQQEMAAKRFLNERPYLYLSTATKAFNIPPTDISS